VRESTFPAGTALRVPAFAWRAGRDFDGNRRVPAALICAFCVFMLIGDWLLVK